MKKYYYLFFIVSIILCIGFANSRLNNVQSSTGSRYVSRQDGVLRMYVNIWGHVSSPGRILVDDGIDLATLLSLTGGPMKGANMKNVRVYHEYPDENGNNVHIIDLTNFIETGDRSNFITIQPNDTFIITFIFKTLGTVSTGRNISN